MRFSEAAKAARQLLGARLEVAIEASHQPFGGESGSDFLVRGECQIAEGVGRYGIGIRLRLAVELRHTFTAQGAQREALACCLGCWFSQFVRLTCAYDTIIAAFASEIIEHDLGRPLLGRRHARDLAHERHGHRSDSRQEDAEDGAGGLDIGIGPMRRERGAERLHQIEQTMRLQTRECDARKVERIDPRVLQQRVATGMPGGERAVELGIVRDDFRVPHEFHQFRQGLGWKWRIRHILVVDIGQVGDVFRDRLSRVHERDEPVDDPPLLHASGSDLRQLVVIERESCCLGVDDHDIAIKIPEIASAAIAGSEA